MTFTQEDIKRIASNIKAIRLAFGYKSQLDFALALDRNGHYPGLSYDMIKKYESGHYQITEQTVRLISSLTLFTFEQIAFEDLSDLEPDSLVVDDIDLKMLDSDEEMLGDMAKVIDTIFPLFSSEKSMESKEFSAAYDICTKKLCVFKVKEEDVIEAINLFIQAGTSDSYANIMSLAGRLYVTYFWYGMKREVYEGIQSEKYDSFIDLRMKIAKLKGYDENAVFMANAKRKYLDSLNDLLSVCMAKAAKVNKYKDYVYYYLAARYYFGIMDNDITKMSDDEMNSFGMNMMECLEIIGNKYAIAFKNAFKE